LITSELSQVDRGQIVRRSIDGVSNRKLILPGDAT
jgi:hypothetical protein